MPFPAASSLGRRLLPWFPDSFPLTGTVIIKLAVAARWCLRSLAAHYVAA
jgi:hypothetical protein